MDSLTTKESSPVDRFSDSEKDLSVSQAVAILWDQGEDVGSGSPDRLRNPYSKNEWVYACVNEILKAARSIDMMISTGQDQIVESGDAYELLFRNPDLPFSKFLTETVGFFALYRVVYWVFDEMAGNRPKKILVVGPEQLKQIKRQGEIIGWELRMSGGRNKRYAMHEVYPVTDFNPYVRESSLGQGPTSVGSVLISSSYQAALFNESLLSNGARVGIVMTLPGRLTDDEIRLYRSQLESRHAGAENAGRALIVSAGAEVKSLSQSMADLQMIDLRKFDAKAICAALFGVPPELVGLATEAQFAHGPAQQRFIANTIAPLLSFLEDHITIGILHRFKTKPGRTVSIKEADLYGSRLPVKMRSTFRRARTKARHIDSVLFAWFNTEDHPTMQEMLRERADKVLNYTKAGIPLNQIISAYDLPFEHVAWGDDHWVPMGLVPARLTLEAGLEGITGPSLPEGEEEGEKEQRDKDATEKEGRQKKADVGDEQQRLRLWQNWVVSWAGVEREYAEALRKFFLRQQRILTKKLKETWNLHNPKTHAKALADELIARVVFDFRVEDGKIKVINHVHFEKASELGIRQALSESSQLAGEELNEAAERIKGAGRIKQRMQISTQKITGVNRVTQKRITAHIRQALDKGESLQKLTDRIAETLGSNRKRALGIARTGTAGAVSTGRHEGMRHAGVDGKSWITAGDPQVRDAHRNAGIDYSQPIPLEQPFVVDGESLMHPSDPAGSAANIVNCRCLQIARAIQGKQIDISIFVTMKFYSYEDMKKDKGTAA